MDLITRVTEIIEPSLTDMGFELVRVRMTGSRDVTLQIMADRIDGGVISVEDCADISHAVSALLDVEDPITGAYTLEVSSPGIDRPLTKPAHFQRFTGFDAKIELAIAVEGRKRFSGRLQGMDGDMVRLEMDGTQVALSFPDIRAAKLILTDELIEAARQEALAAGGGSIEGGEVDLNTEEDDTGAENSRTAAND